jgi:hypothetical protein
VSPDAQPGVPGPDDPEGATGVSAEDAALDEALRELFAESGAKDPGEPPAVIVSWYRGVSGLL